MEYKLTITFSPINPNLGESEKVDIQGFVENWTNRLIREWDNTNKPNFLRDIVTLDSFKVEMVKEHE